jgi:hypothetical protein
LPASFVGKNLDLVRQDDVGQQAALPVIGFLSSSASRDDPNSDRICARSAKA